MQTDIFEAHGAQVTKATTHPHLYNAPMEADSANILTDVRDRRAFRGWLERYHAIEVECWVEVRRGRPTDEDVFWYLDAVEEALCFGWVDSIHKEIGGVHLQRFTPRKPRSPWTERCTIARRKPYSSPRRSSPRRWCRESPYDRLPHRRSPAV